MSSLSVDGLVSGLDTTALIRQLMQLERQPQVRLQARRSDLQKVVDLYRQMNTRFDALETAAEKLSRPGNWAVSKATSSNADVAAVTSTGSASASSLTFAVTALARAHAVIGSTAVADPEAGSVVSGDITIGDTVIPHADLGAGTMREVAAAINASAAGVTASVVQVAPGQYKLQIAAKATGAASTFTVGGLGGLGTFDVVTEGADASLTVGDGPGAYTVVSGSNTFAGLVDGVTITARSLGSTTVDVARDDGTLADRVEALVRSVNDATALIRTNSTYDPNTRKAGPLLSDRTADELRRSLTDAITRTVVDGRTAADHGITVDRHGVVSFDREKFTAALEADPAATQRFLSANAAGTDDDGIAEQIRLVADRATKFGTGQLAVAIEQRQTSMRTLDQQIASYDNRLSLRETAYKRQFAALESALSSLQSQGTWLAGAIGSLPKWQ